MDAIPARGWVRTGAGIAITLAALAGAARVCPAQQAQDGQVVRRIEIRGLTTISEGFIRRSIKTRENQPLSLSQLQEDVRGLLQTRKFLNAFAETRVEDGQAVIILTVQEKPEIVSIELDGNKRFSESELFELLTFSPRSPMDLYAINKGRDDILQKYKEKGYYYATVAVDELALQNESRVVYRITEGPRVRVRRISFEGNRSFPSLRLRTKISTRTYIWIFRTGEFDQEKADRDAVDLQTFYRDQGFLDARVGYRVEFDEVDRTRLALVFVIQEGQRYRVRSVKISGNTAFDADRLTAEMQLKPGGFMLEEARQTDLRRIRDLYGEIGYVDLQGEITSAFVDEPGLVDVRVQVSEGKPSRFGLITITGNHRTKDEVVRRELRFYPGEPFNTVKARRAENRLRDTQIFSRATITPLEDVAGEREALVEVEEADAIQFIIGGGVSTDSGVTGMISIENRNFDLFAWPTSAREFFRGNAFRGDGQRLKLQLEPGTEVSRFRIDFTEPYFLDQRLALGTSAYLFQRSRDAYDEERLGGILSFDKRFESGLLADWGVEAAFRVEQVDISNITPLASRQIRDVRGTSFLTSIRGTIARDTTDSRVFPTEGYRLSFSWEQVGALGGDFDFSKPSASFTWYKTLQTDIFDRKSVLAARADAAYIAGDAPVFERYYAGGFGSLRGFDFRGVSPRAGILDNAVGGDFIMLTGAEYSFPLYSNTLRGVTFIDMGTVEREFEITTWRVSVGFGFRITIDFFGGIPFVFDFGFPIASQSDDAERVFNFNVGASF